MRQHLNQARASARLAGFSSRPQTPDLDFDLDTMQDFLASLPDADPPVVADVTRPSQSPQRESLLSQSDREASPSVPTPAPPLPAPVVAEAFAHSPALARRYQALQKQQSSRSADAALSLLHSSPLAASALPPLALQHAPPVGLVGGHDDLSAALRRQSHELASPSGRSASAWSASGMDIPAFALPQPVLSRPAPHGHLQTIVEESSSLEQPRVLLPQINALRHAQHAGQVQATASADCRMAQHFAGPDTCANAILSTSSRHTSDVIQLPSLKASPPPSSHPVSGFSKPSPGSSQPTLSQLSSSHAAGPRRGHSDLSSARPTHPVRTASDIHTLQDADESAGAAYYADKEERSSRSQVQDTSPNGKLSRSASSLQSQQSISSQASHTTAVKEQRYKVQLA